MSSSRTSSHCVRERETARGEAPPDEQTRGDGRQTGGGLRRVADEAQRAPETDPQPRPRPLPRPRRRHLRRPRSRRRTRPTVRRISVWIRNKIITTAEASVVSLQGVAGVHGKQLVILCRWHTVIMSTCHCAC